eukprot:TRINITY_DN1446_c0_g1_i1.p1 TRINITY_DN1446_c0_g1~~TRINITY_DN1446_c0_g1_i1.p1  ORF type:complete len:572 (+),score=133.63 TRINITY_DN1446_c0_g1_i1:72-1787(+)
MASTTSSSSPLGEASIVTGIPQTSDLLHVESRITKVTVFGDRAQVTRTSQPVNLNPQGGEHTLVFVLPNGLDKRSVQVGTSGAGVVLKGVQFRTEQLAVGTHAQRNELEAQKKELEEKNRVLQDQVALHVARKSLVEGIVAKMTAPSKTGEIAPVELDISAWQRVVEFQQKSLAEVSDALRPLNAEIHALRNRVDLINRQLGGMGREPEYKTQEVVHVIVVARPQADQKPEPILVSISYVVNNASWTPLYDVRVSGQDKLVTVVYYGMVSQSTPESWDDVELELSTARPQFGGVQPSLTPWYVRFGHAYSRRQMTLSASSAMSNRMPMMQQMMASPELESISEMSNCFEPMEAVSAAVDSKATSVFFGIAGRHTIAGDNQPVKVTIMQQPFPAHFRYSTVPKLEQHAYLKARVVNATEYSLLPGEANVFLDNNFVATTNLDLCAPTQDFWVFLGVDDAIQVTHKLVRRFEQTEGWLLSAKRRKVIYEYLMEIKNFKKTTEEVVLWDQLPISQDKQIVVEAIEPKYEKDTDTLKKNSSEFLEWFFNVKPGDKTTVPFKFSVEYPSEQTVSGI